MRCLLTTAFLAMATSVAGAPASHPPAQQPGILVLAVDDVTRPYVRQTNDGFNEAVLASSDAPAVYFESLDASRFAEDRQELFRTWLAEKYRGHRIDMTARVMLALASLLLGATVGAVQPPLAQVASIPLPGVEGRIDHLAFDPARQRLFVAALGNNTVEVLDVKNGSRVKSLPGFREPQGIAVAGDADTVAVANGEGEGIQLLSAEDFRPGSMIRLGEDADNIRYDASARRLYVGFDDGALAAIDPGAGRLLGQVKLAGHPESFQLEHEGSRVFVNVPNAGHIAVVDRASMKVTSTC